MNSSSRKQFMNSVTVTQEQLSEIIRTLNLTQELTIKNPQGSRFEIEIFMVPEGIDIPFSDSGKFSGDPEGAPEISGLIN